MNFSTNNPERAYLIASAIVLVLLLSFAVGAYFGYTTVRDHYHAQNKS